jgi:hypothetical protein
MPSWTFIRSVKCVRRLFLRPSFPLLLSSFVSAFLSSVRALLTIPTRFRAVLYPYSYTCSLTTPDEENQSEALLRMSAALKRVHGRQFETGSVCEVSLTSPGESLDWTYSTAKIRWSFATELRDAGVFGASSAPFSSPSTLSHPLFLSLAGFLLPPSQIRPSGEEMSAGLRSLTQFVLDVRPFPLLRPHSLVLTLTRRAERSRKALRSSC